MTTVSNTVSKSDVHRRFLDPLHGKAISPPPIWLMRQAGRYLPEYRATRADAGSFLSLCYNPALATEVTLQPIRRYGFDAAILFSDILVVPDALGQSVSFVEGEGPRLDPIREAAALARLKPEAAHTKYAIICETVARLRQDLPRETALIGFCGAPWTVATYMVGGQGSTDQAHARGLAYRDPKAFQQLMDILVDSSIEYLSAQVTAGADVLQIFDSWAGSLPDGEFAKWVIAPTQRIVAALKAKHPGTPIIGFPRGTSGLSKLFMDQTRVDAISCDTAMPLSVMRELQNDGKTVQGNVDPLLLVAGGDALNRRIDETLATLGDKPFIFNLGHGIVPHTPPAHVAQLVERVRAWKA
jgi:uroporphyrinogen decarboxylase